MLVLINNSAYPDFVQGSLQISNQTDGIRSCSISFHATLPIIKDGDEIEIFDGPQMLQYKVFGGIVTSYSVTYLSPLTDDYPVVQIDVQSDGYEYITTRRVVNVSRTNTTASTVVLDMLGPNLLGAETIFTGTVFAGATITNYTVTNKTIREVLDDMANLSGYVWYIDIARHLHFVTQQAVVTSMFELVDGGTFKDFHDLSWSGGVDNYCNKVTVVGAGTVSVTLENAAEIARRATEADGQGTGVYSFVIQDSNLTTVAAATAVAQNHLRKFSVSPGTLSFSSYTKGWAPGTKLKVQMATITGMNNDPNVIPSVPNIWYYVIEEVSLERENRKVTKYNISATRRYDTDFSTQKSAGFAEYFKNLVKK